MRENQTVGENDRTAGFLILVGAALAAGVGFVGRRRFGKRQQPDAEVQPEPERGAVHTFERPVPAPVPRRAPPERSPLRAGPGAAR